MEAKASTHSKCYIFICLDVVQGFLNKKSGSQPGRILIPEHKMLQTAMQIGGFVAVTLFFWDILQIWLWSDKYYS